MTLLVVTCCPCNSFLSCILGVKEARPLQPYMHALTEYRSQVAAAVFSTCWLFHPPSPRNLDENPSRCDLRIRSWILSTPGRTSYFAGCILLRGWFPLVPVIKKFNVSRATLARTCRTTSTCCLLASIMVLCYCWAVVGVSRSDEASRFDQPKALPLPSSSFSSAGDPTCLMV